VLHSHGSKYTSAGRLPIPTSRGPSAANSRDLPGRQNRYARATYSLVWSATIASNIRLSLGQQPIMFVLLFAFVFGAAIATGGGASYREFLLPGMRVLGRCCQSAPGDRHWDE
jgi:hypothetical protein